MYTTPRKVKQESRLRRSLSLTNSSRNGSAPSMSTVSGGDKEEYSSGEYQRHLHNIEESKDSNTYFQFNEDLGLSHQRSRFSDPNLIDPNKVPGLVDCSNNQDKSIVVSHLQSVHYRCASSDFQQPPPYRVPPQGEIVFGPGSEDPLIVVTPSDPQHQGVPDSPISLDSLQIHSSKFPIVKEVVISSSSHPNPSVQNGNNYFQGQEEPRDYRNNTVPIPVLSPEYIKKFQNKKLTKKQQLSWTDERKAFTLDSQTAKDIQRRLASYPITRTSSADLGKAIQDFNEEQTRLMSSMQGIRRMENGIDNPGLDLGSNGHIHNSMNYASNGKMSGGGYNYPDSSTSNSLSLSSSNTDSLDTVIYKGPTQSTPSIRDWQRSMEANGDFGHNGYRDASLLDSRGAYQMQQHPTSSYQQMQQQQQQYPNGAGSGGNNGYAIEYRHSQQQHQVQQNLSVHSIPSSSTGNNGGNNNMLRSGNGTTYGSNPQLASKSPMLTHKQFSTAGGQAQASQAPQLERDQQRVTFAPNPTTLSDPMLDTKQGKDAKHFPTKTYNQIKDMISSRFGHGQGQGGNVGNGKGGGLNNAAVNNGANSASVSANNNEQNAAIANSYIDLTMGIPSSYPNSSAHLQNSYNASNGMISRPQANNGPSSYYPQQTVQGGVGAPPPQSYRSPNMNERKNVNTSFRKAIQQSTMKSNLTEESLQLRPIIEQQAHPSYNQMQPQFSGSNNGNQSETVIQERAKRALDMLTETGPCSPAGNPTVYNRVQQFSSNHDVQSRPQGSGYGKQHPQNPQQLRSPASYSVKPGPGSSNSNSSSGLQVVDSSLSSPGSYNGNGNNRLMEMQLHPHPHSHQWTQHHQQMTSPSSLNDQPPPLPTSKKPESPEGSINTIGLPLHSVEMRENGDGSSSNMEMNGGSMSMILEKTKKNDQLQQITADLQNIALSVAAEQHLHNNHSSSSECEKGPQRVGSGQSHTTSDSGLGTVILTKSPLNSNSDPGDHHGPVVGRPNADSASSGNDSEWVDLVEPEIQHILEIERTSKSGMKQGGMIRNPSGPITGINNNVTTSTPAVPKQFQHSSNNNNNNCGGNNSTNPTALSKSQTGIADISASPILHSKQQHNSPNHSPKASKKMDINAFSKKASRSQSQEILAGPSTSQGISGAANKVKSPRVAPKVQRSNSGSNQRWPSRPQRISEKMNPKAGGSRQKEFTQTLKGAKITRNAMTKLGQLLHSLQDETGDITSTTGLDFESVLDGHTEFTTDDDDLSTTIDTTDAHAIRRQLESLESMYTEVLKVLGEKKFSRNRYPPNTAELRAAKRRPFGSMSSLPSSVSSRPFRDRRKIDDKKKVKDLKSINRRFQRLESHVVTLARSVAHLSSEMRTQHLMVQEMDSIRNELSQLRNQVVKNTMHTQSSQNFNRASTGRQGTGPNPTDWTSFRNALPSLTNPCRVRKLTKFFGNEPPLMRIFLSKLGYENYAPAFEKERIGIMELPYVTEERLNKMGIPMGPRLRILQEAQICLKPGGAQGHRGEGQHASHHQNHNAGNLSVYVV